MKQCLSQDSFVTFWEIHYFITVSSDFVQAPVPIKESFGIGLF